VDNIKSLQRFSRRLKYLFIILLILAPIWNIIFWSLINDFSSNFQHKVLPIIINDDLLASSRIMGFIVNLIPLSVIMYGLYTLVTLFSLYEQGIVFERKNVTRIKNLGRTLVVLFFALVVYTLLVSMAISYQNPPGQRMLVLEIGFSDFITLFTGLVLLALAKVMEKGRELSNEFAKVI